MIKGDKVTLRAYTRDDLQLAKEYLNDKDVSAGLRPGIIFPYRLEDEEKWYESNDPNSTREYSFAIERNSDNTYIGGCGVVRLDLKNRSTYVGIFLGKPHWRKGYGTEALRILIDFCFDELNLDSIRLSTFSFNKQAIMCYEKIGFVTEGALRQRIYRQGEYHDELIMSILRDEWIKTNK